MSSPLLDEELRQILVLRWQLCEADLPAGEDLPYSAAWTRAQLLYQVLTEFYTETEAGRVAGLQAPGEVAGIAAIRDAARALARSSCRCFSVPAPSSGGRCSSWRRAITAVGFAADVVPSALRK